MKSHAASTHSHHLVTTPQDGHTRRGVRMPWRRLRGSLRLKTIAIIAITLFGLLIILYIPLRLVLLGSFADLEAQRIRANVERVRSSLDDELAKLSSTAGDYAAWDDTYAFVANPDQTYVEANLADSTFINSQLNLVLIVDGNGNVVFSKAFDLRAQQATVVPAQFRTDALRGSPLLAQATPRSSTTGILLLPDAPMLLAARPIVTSANEGPVRGTVIMGRYLNDAKVQALAGIVHLAVTVHRLDSRQLAPDVLAVQQQQIGTNDTYVQPLSEKTIGGYAVLNDVYRRPAVMLRIEAPRDIYAQGRASLFYFTIALLAAGVVFGLVMLVLLERVVLSRLARLSTRVIEIGATSAISARVAMPGNDELARLAQAINTMLAELEQAHIERKRMTEEQLNRKLESVSTLAGGISHDFGNILTAILGHIALVKLMIAPIDESYQMILGAEKAAMRAKDLATQLLTFAKGGMLSKQTTNIAELIRDSATFVLRGSNVRCETHFADDLWRVDVDQGQINQVIDNLVLNAQQAMPNGGVITIQAENATIEDPLVGREDGESIRNYVRITIEDHGTGIPADHLDKIFDPYFTTKTTGNGLGLAMCYSIIRKHDGLISVDSLPGEGTIFRILLPATPVTTAHQKVTHSQKDERNGTPAEVAA